MFDFIINKDKDTAFTFDLGGGLEFKSYLSFKKSKRLFVLFNGAVDLSKAYPYYQRWGWKDRFPGSVLYIVDPLIAKYKDSGLNLAWYIGDKNVQFSNLISDFVDFVSNGLEVEKVYSYGSSGGGFASLMLGRDNDSVYPISINPQTNIFSYHKPAVDKYISTAWDDKFSKDINSELFNVLNYSNKRCLYVQNLVDTFHYKNHFLKFMDRNNLLTNQQELFDAGGVSYILYDHPNGHGAEPDELFPHIIKTALFLNNDNKA